jgi:hypothetical protein
MRPTRSALPWVPPLVPLNRHANAAAILRCQTRRSRADQSIHFVSAESSQPETHSRANKQLASGQIHDEARTIQSIPPPTKKNTQKTREKSGQLKPVRKRSSERPLMESPRRGVAAADPAGRAAPIHRQRTSFFFQAILPGLDLLLPRTDEKLDALPSAYFRWEWEGPGTKGNFANFRARKRNRRLYSRRALLLPTTADSGSAEASCGLQPAMEWHFYNGVPQILLYFLTKLFVGMCH